jgi:hypothetical protein
VVFLNPKRVELSGLVFGDVAFVSVDRVARRIAKEWSDDGPFPRYVDVVEQEVIVRVSHTPERGEVTTPTLGASGTLTFATSPNASDTGGRTFSMTGVVTSVRHSVGQRGVTRSIEIVGTSSTGLADPISITSTGGAA